MNKLITLIFFLSSTNIFAQTELINNFNKHITTLASTEYGGRKPHTKGDTLSVNYITDQLSKIDGIQLLGSGGLQIVKEKKEEITFNVVARIDAPKEMNPDGKSIVIGAHYDHLGAAKNGAGQDIFKVGADDNASGVAFVIEYARYISTMRDNLKRDVIFILFGAEEYGLVGSRYYATHPLHKLKKSVAMVNFDMTGRMRNKGITIRGLGSSDEAPVMFASLQNKDKLNMIWEFEPAGPTDYASFYKAGIPAFSFSTRMHSDYHTERDTPDKINYTGMEMLFRYAKELVDNLIFTGTNLTYQQTAEPIK
ncbi:MAG: M20/M25/M40 family metallo-hydrolase [Rikenellaceae bacterium]